MVIELWSVSDDFGGNLVERGACKKRVDFFLKCVIIEIEIVDMK